MVETCFVIMPFGGKFDDTYRNILIPAIEASGYKPVRGDDFYRARPVIEDIFGGIKSASVLVADISGKNPNVNYEIGAAHALNKPVIIIYQNEDDIPFNYYGIRAYKYDTQSVNWVAELSTKITNALKARKEEAQQISNQEGREMGLVGKWVGKLNQQTDDGFISLDTDMEINLTPTGVINGTWTLHSKTLIGYQIVFNISCTTLYNQFVKLDFSSADKAIMSFGTLMTRLSASARTIEGQYVGYGSVSDRLVTGSVSLHKALDK